jgi:hypothetical protein
MGLRADCPPGFVLDRTERTSLLLRADLAEPGTVALLQDPAFWMTGEDSAAPARGRGRVARRTLTGGLRALVKRLWRGGLLGALWRGRFVGTRRFASNLRLPGLVAARGVATAPALALLSEERPRGLHRAWLMVEEIEGADDLGARLDPQAPPVPDEIARVMSAVRRMHDRGVDHRDLNLGNVLLRGTGGDAQVFFVDLDRAVLRPAGVSFGRRQSALRRMERSYWKLFRHSPGFAPDAWRSWFALYAGADGALARRLDRGRALGRLWLAFHRIGWLAQSGRGKGGSGRSDR